MATPSLKEQNLQSSLLFMQQDHAKTLKGLHDEINKLQTKCKDLTFQLAMETTSTSHEEIYDKKLKEKDEEVVRWRTKAKELEETISEKDGKISQLQKRLKRLEYKHLEELKTKAEALQRVQADLLSKSEEISALQMSARTSVDSVEAVDVLGRRRLSSGSSPRTSLGESPRASLHRAKPSSATRRMSCESDTLSESGFGSVSVSGGGGVSGMGGGMGSSSGNRYPGSHPRHSFNAVINRPASGRKLVVEDADSVSMSFPSDSQATAEILEITKSQRLHFQSQGSASSSASSSSGGSRLLPPIAPTPPKGTPPRLHKTNSASFSRRKPATESEPVNVETLAVDQVNGSRKINLRRAQEFNSQDGP